MAAEFLLPPPEVMKKLHALAQKVGSLKRALPQNMRIYLSTVAGIKDDITEDNFTEEELERLRSIVTKERFFRDFRSQGDTGKEPAVWRRAPPVERGEVNYVDYNNTGRVPNQVGDAETKMNWSPQLELASDPWLTTLGTAKVKLDDEGNTVVVDTYNFNYATRQELDKWSFSEEREIFGGDLKRWLGVRAAPSDEGRNVRINLGKLDR